MPIFFQHQINDNTRLGVWKIEETPGFFKGKVPQHRHVTHPHKQLQHLAGRFLLQFLFPDFPYEQIQIADTRKPFLPDEKYHFSISHCGDYAAAIVSSKNRVGIDVELPIEKIGRIVNKFLSEREKKIFKIHPESYRELMLNTQVRTPDSGLPTPDSQPPTLNSHLQTLLWSAKESVFKWYGNGGVDFRKQIQLLKQDKANETIDCCFSKDESELIIHYRQFDGLVLAWVIS